MCVCARLKPKCVHLYPGSANRPNVTQVEVMEPVEQLNLVSAFVRQVHTSVHINAGAGLCVALGPEVNNNTL